MFANLAVRIEVAKRLIIKTFRRWKSIQMKSSTKLIAVPGSWIDPSLNGAQQPKDCGINTKADTHRPSFIPFPFGLEQRELKHSAILFFIIKLCVMSTISVSVHQRSSRFSIYLSASTSNCVVWLPITLQHFKTLLGTCIGCSIQGSPAYLLFTMLAFLALPGFFYVLQIHRLLTSRTFSPFLIAMSCDGSYRV
jgi:hypothetical protein